MPSEVATATPPPADGRVAMSSWWSLAVLWLLYVGSFVDRITISLLVDPIKHDLGLSDVQASLGISVAFAGSYVLFGFPMGWAADRFPRRWVIYLGTTVWSLSAIFSGLSRGAVGLAACRGGVGAGEAALCPAAYSLIGEKFPKRRLTLAMALFQTGSQVGVAAAFLLGGAVFAWAAAPEAGALPLIGALRPWQTTLVVIGALLLLPSLLVFTFGERPRAGHLDGVVDRRSVAGFLKQERSLFLPMLVAFAFIAIAVGSLTAWVPTFVKREYGLGPASFGPTLGLVTLISALTMPLKGVIVDRLSARGVSDAPLLVFSWLIGVALPIAALAFSVHHATIFLVFYGIVYALIGELVVYATATFQRVTPPRLLGQMVGIFMALSGLLGFGVGPVAVATVTDHVLRDEQRLGTSLQIVTLFSLAVALVCLQLARRALREMTASDHAAA